MLILSGPVELLFLECLIAFPVCVVVIVMGVLGSLDVCLSIFLLLGCVLCWMTFVNCLLKYCAFCLLVMAILLLKLIEILGCGFGFLLDRSSRVFHSM